MASLFSMLNGQIEAGRPVIGTVVYDKVNNRNLTVKNFSNDELTLVTETGEELTISPEKELIFSYVKNPNEKVSYTNLKYDEENHILSWELPDGTVKNTSTGSLNITAVYDGSYKGLIFVCVDNTTIYAYDVQADKFEAVYESDGGDIIYFGNSLFAENVIVYNDDETINENASYQRVFSVNEEMFTCEYGLFVKKVFFTKELVFVREDGTINVSRYVVPNVDKLTDIYVGGRDNDIVSIIMDNSVVIETAHTTYVLTDNKLREDLLTHKIFVSKKYDNGKETFCYSDANYDIITFVVEHTDRGDSVTYVTK